MTGLEKLNVAKSQPHAEKTRIMVKHSRLLLGDKGWRAPGDTSASKHTT